MSTKALLLITFLFIVTSTFAQIVVGKVVDSKTGLPVGLVNVIDVPTGNGTFTSDSGDIYLKVSKGSIKLSAIGYARQIITNLPLDSGYIRLGEVKLYKIGFAGYVTTKRRCRYVDTIKMPKAENLVVYCADHTVKCKWTIVEKGTLQVDFTSIQQCAE